MINLVFDVMHKICDKNQLTLSADFCYSIGDVFLALGRIKRYLGV